MSKQKLVLRIILIVCVLSVAAFAALIVRELYIDRQSRSFYSNIAADVQVRDSETEHVATEGSSPDTPGEVTGEWKPYVDFDALNQIYPGIVGWIKQDDSMIDYPVMQYRDNDYFLYRLPDGTLHRSGSIFLDYRNESDFSDKSILIFGHESRTGDMFGTLKSYRNQEFFDENPMMHLYTPEKDYMIVIFAGHVADSVRDHPPLEFQEDKDFLDYIEHLKRISVFNSDVEVDAADRIVSLITCTYDFDDARFIIVGVLVEA